MTATRRWCQFRLRTLCVVLAVALGGLGLYRQSVVAQRRNAESLQAQGHTRIRVDRRTPFDARVAPAADGPFGLDDHWFHRVVEVRMTFPQVSNSEAALASRLPYLDVLVLSDGGPLALGYAELDEVVPPTAAGCNSTIDDNGACLLGGLRRLRHLDVRGAQITDVGLAHLTELQDLRELNLARTRITDRAGELLGRLPRLQRLVLCDTQIGDKTLLSLAGCAELKEVDARGTRVTMVAVESFMSRRQEVQLAVPSQILQEYSAWHRQHIRKTPSAGRNSP